MDYELTSYHKWHNILKLFQAHVVFEVEWFFASGYYQKETPAIDILKDVKSLFSYLI